MAEADVGCPVATLTPLKFELSYGMRSAPSISSVGMQMKDGPFALFTQ